MSWVDVMRRRQGAQMEREGADYARRALDSAMRAWLLVCRRCRVDETTALALVREWLEGRR